MAEVFKSPVEEYEAKRLLMSEFKSIPHYYGDVIRILQLVAAAIMLISLPFFKDTLMLPYIVPVLSILAIGLFAGLTNPKVAWVILLQFVVSLAGFIIFEYTAVVSFRLANNYFTAVNQTLAIIFFMALYYSTKTLRGYILNRGV